MSKIRFVPKTGADMQEQPGRLKQAAAVPADPPPEPVGKADQTTAPFDLSPEPSAPAPAKKPRKKA